MEDKELQDKVDNILSGQGKSQQRAGVSSADAAADLAEPAQPRPLFSAFVDQHVTRASELSTHFTQVAATHGLEAAVQAIDNALQQEPVVGLVQYALKLFLTHYPEARGRLKLRPLRSEEHTSELQYPYENS